MKNISTVVPQFLTLNLGVTRIKRDYLGPVGQDHTDTFPFNRGHDFLGKVVIFLYA